MIFEKLLNLLSKEKKFCDNKGNLLKNIIIESALKLDPDLLEILISENEIKKTFFSLVDEILIFDKIKFQKIITNKNFLPDSYTEFENYIGLSSDGKFFKNNQEVVIDFPYKDCVLEGGQTSDDKKNKRKEVFWNQTLASDEIDRLFEPKALTKWKKYNKDGMHNVKEISLKDNLIIKGNNLISLYSIMNIYRGKIKMIYIDPPYNSGGGEDIFTYNNSFKRSTWLTFMKNRLKAANSLLTNDGFIAIAIDHHEVGYLIVLADEIFGRHNRINIITVASNPQGRNQEKFFGTSTEFMIVYAKDIDLANFNQITLSAEKSKEFNKTDSNGNKYKVASYIRIEDGKEKTQQKIKKGLHYPIYVSNDLSEISLDPKKNFVSVYPFKNGVKKVWKKKKESFLKDYEDNLIIVERDEEGNITINEKMYETEVIKTHWVDPKYSARVHGTQRLNKMLGHNSVSYPKSIHTVKDILKLTTKNDDIVLDFFAGSGTTAEAVTILNQEDGGNRRFILAEQLDAHMDECINRNVFALKENDSDNSFIFFELASWNEKAIKLILEAKNSDELIDKLDNLFNNYQLRHIIELKEFYKKITSKDDPKFTELPFKKQQEMLIEIIDFNHLYINFSEMDDVDFKIKKADKELTKKFYKDSL